MARLHAFAPSFAFLAVLWLAGSARAQEGRVFFGTPETVVLYEFNGLTDFPDGSPLVDGTVIPDFSGNGLNATVESNQTDITIDIGDPNFGANREARRTAQNNGGSRIAINDDQDVFEMLPEDDFSLELYVNREPVANEAKWGLLAGTWHSRALADDTLDPNLQGAWYGYGLIRGDEAETPGQWSFVLSPLEAVDAVPPVGCCNERHAYFNIPDGRHYLVLSVSRVDQTAITYLDGVEVGRQSLQPNWTFTTPQGYDHARFTILTGEDDPTRGSYRASPPGTHVDALRFQRKAITADEALENWGNMQSGVSSPPPPTQTIAIVTAAKAKVLVNQCTKVDASSSLPGLGKTITKYEWKVADGVFETGDVTKEVSFDTSSTTGYVVTLRVTNNVGETDEATTTIKVDKVTLKAKIVASLDGKPLVGDEVYIQLGRTLALDGTQSAYEVPLDALRCPLADGLPIPTADIVKYSWDLDGKPATIEDTNPALETAPFTKAGDLKILLQVESSDGTKSTRAQLLVHVADSQGNTRVFHTTPETIVHYEFNELSPLDLPDGTAIPNDTKIKDLSGNGLDGTVEANDAGDLVTAPGVGSLDDPVGSNREVDHVATANFGARVAINDDLDAFEFLPETDFSIELYINRETTNDPVKWGILAGTWHSRTLIDDAEDPNLGAWYGYGLIRADEAVTGGQWSWVMSPLLNGPDTDPSRGCCPENHGFFNIAEGRHYVAFSIDRVAQMANSYLDGKLINSRPLQPLWSFTTPPGWEHSRFTLFTGEDDPSRGAYRAAPSGTHIDAFRVQNKALSPADAAANYSNIVLGKGANPEFAPAKPAMPTALVATTSDKQVDLDWADNTEANLVGYHILRSQAAGPFVQVTTTALTQSAFADAGLTNGTEYCYKVVAVNPAGKSPEAGPACGTPQGADVGPKFIRGDSDANGSLELTDAVGLLNFLFLGAGDPGCQDAADFDDNGSADISDAIANLGFQFLGGAQPAQPYPGCGNDSAPDENPAIGCQKSSTGC